MAFTIDDPETGAAVRRLARMKGTGLAEAVREACEHEYERVRAETPLIERLKRIQDEYAKYPKTGLKADKAFYDSLNDE